MATALFLIGFMGLMIYPSKYISSGGYGLLFTALCISQLLMKQASALQDWTFWVAFVLAVGYIGYWLKGH